MYHLLLLFHAVFKILKNSVYRYDDPHLAIGEIHQGDDKKIANGHLPFFGGQGNKDAQNKHHEGGEPEQIAETLDGRGHQPGPCS